MKTENDLPHREIHGGASSKEAPHLPRSSSVIPLSQVISEHDFFDTKTPSFLSRCSLPGGPISGMLKWLRNMAQSAYLAVRRSRLMSPSPSALPRQTKAQYQRNHRAAHRRRLDEIKRGMPAVIDEVVDASSRARDERRLRRQIREDRRRGIL